MDGLTQKEFKDFLQKESVICYELSLLMYWHFYYLEIEKKETPAEFSDNERDLIKKRADSKPKETIIERMKVNEIPLKDQGRPDELFGLKWQDVKWQDSQLKIERTFNGGSGLNQKHQVRSAV